MLVCQYFGEIPIQIHSVFSRQVSLCKLGWHQTHRDLSTRASWVLGSKVCITTLSQGFYFWYFWDLLLLRAYMYIHTAFLPACLFLLIPLFLFLLSHLSSFFILSSPRPLSCFLGQDLGMYMCPGFAWIVEPSHSMAESWHFPSIILGKSLLLLLLSSHPYETLRMSVLWKNKCTS